MKKIIISICVLGVFIGTASAHEDQWAAQSNYEIDAVKSIMVPMRDGVRLSTDLYMPASGLLPDDPELMKRILSLH
jgi:predicted acyl esterase